MPDTPLVREDAAARAASRRNLVKFAWLSIAAAVITITLKTLAWRMTGSVGLLSDAAESVVNLVAAVAVLIALIVSARPADKNHHYGHAKAEYFSAAVEGQMIFIAAVVIIYTAIERLLNPAPLENVGIGLGISVLASVVNGLVAMVLLRAARKHRSITLRADGQHLLTDVWTSAGVVVGVALVWLTGIERLDPIIALLVGINIIITGGKLFMESVNGLMDISMSKEDNQAVAEVLSEFVSENVHFHALRTRVSGHSRFGQVHVLVPGHWTVQQSHDLVEDIEAAMRARFDDFYLVCHVEPAEDPKSYEDIGIGGYPVPAHHELVRARSAATSAPTG